MGLAVKGTDVLSYPEFSELMRSLDQSHAVPEEITAWWAGEEIPASALLPALDVGLRLSVVGERGHALIDSAITRMRTAEAT
jgi:hypothetical protein